MHSEFIRIAEGGRIAVLMVHGIVGSPRYFDFIIPLLPKEWSIYNILLDGHGKDVCHFSHSGMKKWKSDVEERLCELCKRYDKVIVIAHSMGTLLVMDKVQQYKEKIHSMILFAPPVCPKPTLYAFYVALKVIFGAVDENNEIDKASERQYSIEPDKRLWRYIGFIPRYAELLQLAAQTKKRVGDVKVDCDVFFFKRDEMVSMKSKKYFEGKKNFRCYVLEGSTHNYFCERDMEFVLEKIIEKISEF